MSDQDEVWIQCPYCGEAIEVLIDLSAGDQEYIEDCQVCCRPIEFVVALNNDGLPCVVVRREDD